MANDQNLKPWKPGQSGNPKGMKKGTKHISTWIDEMLNDEEFTTSIRQGLEIVQYKGAPIKAIIAAQIQLALHEKNTKAFDVLAKYGYGSKQTIELTNPAEQILNKFGLGEDGDAGQAPEA